jgi:RNA polymerase sporulation-specific sigma factor
MAIATTSQILETLDSIDLKDLLDRMEDYVRGRFYDKSDQNKIGLQFQDFCQEVLRKACDGTRKWKMEKCSFENFIFGTLRSDLNYFFKKGKVRPDEDDSEGDDYWDQEECYITDVYYLEDLEQGFDDKNFDKIDDKVIIQEWISSLKDQGADNLEIEVFECWTSGIKTPKEVAEYMEMPIMEINNIYKRLRRKKIKLNRQWISLKKQ